MRERFPVGIAVIFAVATLGMMLISVAVPSAKEPPAKGQALVHSVYGHDDTHDHSHDDHGHEGHDHAGHK